MINDKIKTAGLLALFALLPACADDAPFDKGHEPESRTHEYYLRLTLRHPEAGLPTRSTPTGGEPGDGHEPGQDHETRIDDLTLLFYRGTDGVNSDASTPIDKILYLDRDAMEGDNRTEPVPVTCARNCRARPLEACATTCCNRHGRKTKRTGAHASS